MFPLLAAAPADAALPDGEHCLYDVATHHHACFDSLATAKARARADASVTSRGDVVGATVFAEKNYGGESLTITVPEPCPKNDTVDFWLDLADEWKNQVSSVQAWSTCWIWLYPESGDRAGPYDEDTTDVGSSIDDRTVTVGLS